MHTTEKPTAKKLPTASPPSFQRALIAWFDREGRTYPWRETADPYAILVSEIMLQQTQIATVLERGYYRRWMQQFPDIPTLAVASEEAILKAWEGLGYYRRARNLRKLAQVVVEHHDGAMPETLEEILALPGIGPYTAGAIYSFAYDRPAPLVDGNVARVFARLFDYEKEVDAREGQKQLWEWAAALIPDKRARAYNAALMELGQRLCTQAAPACLDCPVAAFCQTRTPQALPNKTPRRATVFQDEHVLFHVRNGKLRVTQEDGSRRRGLWKLPACDPQVQAGLTLLYKAKYSITHHRVTLHVYQPVASVEEEDGDASWYDLKTVSALAMASPYRKAVETILADPLEDFSAYKASVRKT